MEIGGVYNVQPSFHDERDHIVVVSLRKDSVIDQMKMDLRHIFPDVYHAEELGSSSTNAVCAIEWYNQIKTGKRVSPPSRLFNYYSSLTLEKDKLEEAGATIKDAIVALAVMGVCNETTFPYKVEMSMVQPPHEAYIEAAHRKISQYARVPHNIKSIETVLLAGHALAVGMLVYESFESQVVQETGVVPFPGIHENALGGIAVVLVGFDRTDPTKPVFILRNCRGSDWGDDGYFYLPYSYILDRNLTFDLWTLVTITTTTPDVRYRTPIPGGTLRFVSPSDIFFLDEDEE